MTADTAREAEIRDSSDARHVQFLRNRLNERDFHASEIAFLLRLLDEARAEIAKWEGMHNLDSGKIEDLTAELDKAQTAIGELEEMVSDCEEARDNARMEIDRLRARVEASDLERAKEVMRGYCSEYGYDVDGESYEDVIPWIAAALAEVRRAAAKQCETALTGLLIDPVTVEADRAGLGRAIIAIRALSLRPRRSHDGPLRS